MAMMKKSDIKNWREKLILGVGIGVAPSEITDELQRKQYRIHAAYVLGIVLGMTELEQNSTPPLSK